MVQLFKGDCLEVLKNIPDGSIDLILTDLPYGTTKNKWDVIIPFEPMWFHINRVLKPNGCTALFAQAPFDKILGVSNLKDFRYEWVWEKSRPTGHLNANRMPLKNHENILIFYKKLPFFNKQMIKGKPNHVTYGKVRQSKTTNNNYGNFKNVASYKSDLKNPKSVLKFNQQDPNKLVHPTQKPVALLQYLIKTYTNISDKVLDFTMGSGSTGVAAVNLGRDFIGIEKDDKYFSIAEKRILEAEQNSLF